MQMNKQMVYSFNDYINRRAIKTWAIYALLNATIWFVLMNLILWRWENVGLNTLAALLFGVIMATVTFFVTVRQLKKKNVPPEYSFRSIVMELDVENAEEVLKKLKEDGELECWQLKEVTRKRMVLKKSGNMRSPALIVTLEVIDKDLLKLTSNPHSFTGEARYYDHSIELKEKIESLQLIN